MSEEAELPARTDVHAVPGHGRHGVPVAAEVDVGLAVGPTVRPALNHDL